MIACWLKPFLKSPLKRADIQICRNSTSRTTAGLATRRESRLEDGYSAGQQIFLAKHKTNEC